MESENLSIIGLTIQCAGILLVTILSFFMTRSFRRAFLDYWTVAWIALSVALLSLSVAFRLPHLGKLYYPIYFFGEYAFGYLFVAGCRNYASDERLTRRQLYLLIPASAVAVAMPHLSNDFSVLFIPHALILAALFAWSFRALRAARPRNHKSPGLRLVSVALVLLTLDFLHYVPIVAYVRVTGTALPIGYLQYTSVYDLIVETLLGFGTLMMVMDHARHEVEASNLELIAARDKLEYLARIDPLTEALNRHTFYSLMEKKPTQAANQPGCAVVLDIDNLKPINDSFGHAAGDAAIREVARAVRSVIRADDLLFRWGGDEFLILFFNMPESGAQCRVAEIEVALARAELPGATAPTPVIVSYGLAAFGSVAEIEQTIEKADGEMYARKQARKSEKKLVG
ncbi:MAG TPA: GGDEF domain-containing protein [Blastocatellia bacterium]|nr:GGDEF domain-containing protein [Blastocatellia bacterium]